MKDWLKLEPDRIRLMNKHFTPGRGGNTIECVVIHHNAGMLTIDQIWQVWQDRAASAHYQVENGGRIGQLVWDRDTAWHAASQWMNQRSIGIEIANSGGASQGWPISDTAIREGALLAAAVCLYYGLGRPVSGKNIRYHREFAGTSCPHHLAPGGKYNAAFMAEAQRFYDELAAKKNGTPVPATPKEEKSMFGPEQVAALNDAKVAAQSANGTLEILAAPHASLINPAKSFDLVSYLRLMDAAVWETRRLMEAIARHQGLDPEKVIAEAIAADRGEA
ncbi:peptidoglycan recognition protein family protein [Corynebacterium renale]|uniref:peptidoglycan recognition protein family protein n=1 Tax=Corynebacterium renale TaxID=1724 RepID=UPI000DF990F4|nr:peptidoglycan recognition family protein [Corynebacterium renale]STC97468.1 autolysin [Corynebacterium renale]STD70250.1 autolysin [Corynebacterium renale]